MILQRQKFAFPNMKLHELLLKGESFAVVNLPFRYDSWDLSRLLRTPTTQSFGKKLIK